jgi:tetraacyldisaccharide-1-P 4'-kinase
LEQNVFYSGCGGTGKTFVLESIVEILKERFYGVHVSNKLFGECDCFVTAPTGIAGEVN